MYDVGMGAITADACTDKEQSMKYPPKDKPITYKGEKWTIMDDGYLVNVLPHLHDGGLNIKVYLNDKHECTSNAVYSDEGTVNALDGKSWQTITSYTPCDHPIKIKVGDKMHMTAEYDLTKHRL